MINTQEVRFSLTRLFNHPEELVPEDRKVLYSALYSKEPYEQGAVSEILHEAVLALLRRLT